MEWMSWNAMLPATGLIGEMIVLETIDAILGYDGVVSQWQVRRFWRLQLMVRAY